MSRTPLDRRRAGPALQGRQRPPRAVVPAIGACGLILLGAHLGRQAWGVQQTGAAPSVLRPAPGFKGVAVSLPREVLLLRLLQDFSNYIGEPVYADGAIPPTAKIALEERPTRLDPATMGELLEKHSYELSRAPYRGEDVHWVQKLLVPKRKKGGLRPAGTLERGRDGEDASEDAVDQGRDASGESLCLYRRQDGDGARYIVLFETGSKEAAEAALSLLQAHQKSRER